MKLIRERIRVGDTYIYYQEAGSGEPVVLVHGLAGSGRWWARNIPFLAQQFHVLVVDLIGFGGSRRQRFVLEQAAEALVAWLKQLGISRANVIGHSMGGFIASDMAAAFPDVIDRLVLVDAAALPFSHLYWRNPLTLLRALRYVPFGFLPVLIVDAFRAGPITILKAAWEIFRADISAKLSRIHAPTLVIWGENDHLIPIEIGQSIERALPNANLVVMEGAGHNPMWDRPDRFNHLLTRFLIENPPVQNPSSGSPVI